MPLGRPNRQTLPNAPARFVYPQVKRHKCRTLGKAAQQGRFALPILVWLWLCSILASSATGQELNTNILYNVQAGYLFNFAKYVEWPTNAFHGSSDPILIGIYGADPFGDRLEKAIGKRTIDGRRVEAHRGRKLADLKKYHIVYISRSEADKIRQIVAGLQGGHALTVSDMPQFCAAGGMVGLFVEGEVVRFEVQLDAANDAGLKISARMLNSAKNVYTRKRP